MRTVAIVIGALLLGFWLGSVNGRRRDGEVAKPSDTQLQFSDELTGLHPVDSSKVSMECPHLLIHSL